jgi:SAM-dependent methyltransferase
MVKYVAAAVALKCLSVGKPTRRFYRALGNKIGNNRRSSGQMPSYYLERVRRTLQVANQHGIVRDGHRAIELGTGWLHWEALTLRLFWDVEAVLFDVWDNRQLGGLKNYWSQLRGLLESNVPATPAQVRRAKSVLDSVAKVDSFEELYERMGFRYVVQPDGSLDQFADASFDLVVSGGVLEHVHRNSLPALAAGTRRILRLGGIALHSIDTSDHLSHYDSSVSKKKYLSYSEPTWRLLFENEVQYINRLQRGEWIELFKSNGFDIIEEDSRRIDISNVRPTAAYGRMHQADLACTTVRVTLRRIA